MVQTDQNDSLLRAARTGDSQAAKHLLEDGASANALDKTTGLTALMYAAGIGAVDCMRVLVEGGGMVNAVDHAAGTAALHKACQGGHAEAVRLLLDSGAWVNQQTTTTGHTPLVEAIWFKSVEIVQYLLEHGARCDLGTYYGFSVDDHINYALRVNTGGRRHALLSIQALVAAQRQELGTIQRGQLLQQAILRKDFPGMQAALDAGANIEERTPIAGKLYDGHTPLLLASLIGSSDMVSELLSRGADPNAVDPIFGAVPLHKATYNGYCDIARLLAQHPGTDLNYQGPSNGYTPLHDALWHGFAECAKVLLDAGCQVDIVAYDGMLPVDIARAELASDNEVRVLLERTTPTEVSNSTK